jgi:peptide/nickel transport system ATP-binding protein
MILLRRMQMSNNIIEVKNLKKYFPVKDGSTRKNKKYLKAVDGVSFTIKEGETLGLVGESGSGKTTLGRTIVRVYEPTDGTITLKLANGNDVELTKMSDKELRPIRENLHMIFQDPYTSLNPRMTVFDIISEPLVYGKKLSSKEITNRVIELMELVGLKVPHMKRYPHAFSGGQRQRIGIARSLASNPRFIVCDEAVSALDVSIQAQVINLLQDLQKQLGLTYLFIAHDLSVVQHISDRVAVMYVGAIVEMAPTNQLFTQTKHPYTEALLSAIPGGDFEGKNKRIILDGEIANPVNPPSGCTFHPRCRYATDICKKETPVWQEIGTDHFVSCHHATELTLKAMVDEE